jgi:hypothetical protein
MATIAVAEGRGAGAGRRLILVPVAHAQDVDARIVEEDQVKMSSVRDDREVV